MKAILAGLLHGISDVLYGDMGRSRAQAATLARRLLPLAVVVLLLAMPATVAAEGTECSVTGSSTSGGPVDLLTTPVWHLRSTDQVTARAYAPTPQADVTVSAYALGFAIPIASGTSGGGTTVAEADYDMSTFGSVGRVFIVSGASSGSFGRCEGVVTIVLDDVSPFATVLGAGSVVVSLIGLIGAGLGVRNPSSRGRRFTSLLGALLLLAGGSVLLQHISNPGEAAADLGPSALAAALPGPTQVTLEPLSLLAAAGLSLLVVLVMPFPAELFNRTLEGNVDRLRGAARRIPLLGRLVRAESPEAETARRASRSFGALLFVLLAGLLYGFLDPTFGPDGRSAVTFGGIVAALVLVTWLQNLPVRAAHRAASPDGTDRGQIDAVLGTLVVAAACVVISRATGFLPGYLYGLVIGYAFARQLRAEDNARALLAAAWWMLGIAAVCWLMLGAMRGPGVGGTVPGQIAVSVMVAVTVAGVEGIVFGLVPVRFLPGEPIFRWSRVRWAVPYAIGLFAFIWIILNPANGFATALDQAGFVTALWLFIGFGAASILFWAWFRFRPAQAAV
jgi:hypothetical protein